MADSHAVLHYLQGLQSQIVDSINQQDGQPFLRDSWQRAEGGGGLSCILENGAVFERAGVAFSQVAGQKLPPAATQAHPEVAGRTWQAMGVSVVLHPRNPYVPTVHLNVRFFVASAPQQEDVWWFGGGMDLTPYYPFREDVVHFHRTCQQALAPFGARLYADFKAQCDAYFYLPHRQEPRGVGGIFLMILIKVVLRIALLCVKLLAMPFCPLICLS